MDNPDRALWLDILGVLRTQHPELCRLWFQEDIEPLGMGEGVYQVRVRRDIHRRYLTDKCLTPFTEAVQTVTGRLVGVRFLGPDDTPSSPPRPAQQRRRPASLQAESPAPDEAPEADPPASGGDEPEVNLEHKLPVAEPAPQQRSAYQPARAAHRSVEGLVLNPDYTFDQFVIGPENRFAHAAARAVAEQPGRVYNPLFIHGGVGLGKTHLLQAICLAILERDPDTPIHFTSCDGFMTQFFDAVQAGELKEFRHRFRDVDVLVIDDIHFLAKRERTQEEFFHTFNALYQAGKQIVLSSDAPPAEIPALETRLVSRFQSGLVVDVARPNYETRVQIIKQKARLRGLLFPEDVACYVASRDQHNIRELEGAITRIQMLHITDAKPIDLDLARTALDDPSAEVRAEVSMAQIVDVVTNYYSVKLVDLQGKRRQKSIAMPRQVCMYLARRYTRFSLEEIGGYLGGRDHTTVMHGVRTIQSRRRDSEDLDRVLHALESKLGIDPVTR